MNCPASSESASRTPRVLFIGYGNPYRQDDRVGHVVAAHAAARCQADNLAPVQVITAYQLDLDMVEDVARARRVYFMDAHTPTYSTDVLIQPVASTAPDGFTTHVFSPAHLVHLAAQLYGSQPEAFILSIPGYAFDMGDTLSPETERAAAEAVDLLVEHLCANS